jgi:hypothetical protein
LRYSREIMWQKRPELLHDHIRLLYHNTLVHTSLKTTESMTNNSMVIIPHPPYLPDLGPCDFALFPKLKMNLKGWSSETMSDIQRESQVVLNSIKENDLTPLQH